MTKQEEGQERNETTHLEDSVVPHNKENGEEADREERVEEHYVGGAGEGEDPEEGGASEQGWLVV